MSSEQMEIDRDTEMPVLERQDIQVQVPGSSRSSGSDPAVLPGQYEVQSLLGKRWSSELETFQYLVKWKGYRDDESTWEDYNGLDCPEILKKFERECPLPLIIKLDRVPVREPTGFEAGLWPKEITAITHREPQAKNKKKDNVFYKVEWDGNRQPEYICSEVLTERVPMMVLVYLQSIVDISIPANASTTEDQLKKYKRSVDECKKKMKKETSKAKKMWTRTTKLAAD